MTNLLRAEVSLEVSKDEVLSLVFDFDTLVSVEDQLDKSIFQIMAQVQGAPRLGLLRALLWAATRERHPQITPARAGQIIQQVGLVKVTEKLVAGLKASQAPPDESAGAAEGVADPQPGPTGPST
ncbi:hypothetical protein [Phenylobacterium sp.]|jgi:hypothetical protein|uniref:hypothetical protein n=1 Tax=Phenylobacterium sp. TaxID=1871053 RepID=UPI0035AFA6C7